MLLADAKNDFFTYLLGRKNRANGTIATYNKILTRFIDYIGNKPVTNLTVQDIDNYADTLFAEGLAAKTRRNRLAAIRSFVRFLYIKDYCSIKPEQVELPTIKKIEANFLTTEEAQRLVSAITNVRDRAIVLTLLATWARVSELLRIDIQDVYRRSIIIREGKGGEPRTVFINHETERAVELYIRTIRGSEPGVLFQNYRGAHLSPEYIRKMIKRYAVIAGITKNVSCHTLRHTGATGYILNGGSLETANQILGHKSIYTTMIYLHFLNERLHADYDAVIPSYHYS